MPAIVIRYYKIAAFGQLNYILCFSCTLAIKETVAGAVYMTAETTSCTYMQYAQKDVCACLRKLYTTKTQQ